MAASALIAMALALAVSLSLPREYLATASLVLRIPGPSAGGEAQIASQPSRYTADQIAIIESRPVAERALDVAAQERVNPRFTPREVMSRSSVTGDVERNNLIKVSFRAPNRRVAVTMANAMIEAYRETRQSGSAGGLRQLDASLETIDRQLAAVRGELNQLSRDQNRAASPTVAAELVQRQDELLERANSLRAQRDGMQGEMDSGGIALSSPATEAVLAPRGTRLRMAGALIVGLLIGTVIAYAKAVRRVRFSRREEPEYVFGAPLLCEIPRSRQQSSSPLPVLTDRHSTSADSFRFAAAFLEIQTNPSRKIVAVVSASAVDGSTAVAVNTAIAMAQAGVRVALVDADVEGQRASRLILGEEGMASLPEDSLQLFRPMGRALESGDYLDLLSATGGRTLITPLLEKLKSQFDIVIIDVPPLLQAPHAATFVKCAEGAVVLVNHEDEVSTHEEFASPLSSIGTPVIGYVYSHTRLSSRRRDRQLRRAKTRPESGSELTLTTDAASPSRPS